MIDLKATASICLVAGTLAGPVVARQSAAAFRIVCETTTVAVGWSGTESVACQVDATRDTAEDVGLSCADVPDGGACRVEPAVVRPKAGAPASARLVISYTERLPAGQHPVRVIATRDDAYQMTLVTVQKDANTVSARCPSGADIAAIDHDLELSFESDPTKGRHVCSAAGGSRDLTLMQARVYRTLATVRRLAFTEPLPWTRDSLYQWLIKAVRGIRFRGDIPLSSCCQPANTINVRAFVEGAPPHGTGLGIALTESQAPYMNADFRLLGSFLTLIVHEARHNNGFTHTCGTNDRTIAELGSWGVAYYTNVWLAEHAPPDFITPPLRQEFLRAATQICAHQFCDDHCPVK